MEKEDQESMIRNTNSNRVSSVTSLQKTSLPISNQVGWGDVSRETYWETFIAQARWCFTGNIAGSLTDQSSL